VTGQAQRAWSVCSALLAFVTFGCEAASPESNSTAEVDGQVVVANDAGVVDCGSAGNPLAEPLLAPSPLGLKFEGPDEFFKPDAVGCAELGIAECRRLYSCGAPAYSCRDAAGLEVAFLQPYSAVNYGETTPCTRGQFESWLELEADDCATSVPLAVLPLNALLWFDKDVMSNVTACGNVTSTRFRLKLPTGTIRLVQLAQACGSNQGQTGWAACVTPASADVWRTEFPFLACSHYQSCGWNSPGDLCLALASDCGTKCVKFGEHVPGVVDWEGVFQKFAKEFNACPNAAVPP
jgi:hypothetical protein